MKISTSRKYSFVSICLSLLLASILVINTTLLLPLKGQLTNGPHIDRLEFVTIKDPSEQVLAMKSGLIDKYPGLIRPADVEELSDNCKTIIATPGGHMSYFTFNLREYAGPTYGESPSTYDKRCLRDPWFRLAVAYLTPKVMLIGTIFKYVVTRIDSVVPPQMTKYHNPAVVKYNYDPVKAFQTLLDHGYYYDGSSWYYDAAFTEPLGNIKFRSPSFDECPTSYAIVDATVEEMHVIGLTNVEHVGTTFIDMLNQHVYPHNFDMFFLRWSGLGPDPDHLWAFFNSVNDVYQGRNHPGVNDPQIDALTNTIHTSLDDDGEVVPAAMQLQELLADPTKWYGLCYIPIYSRNYYDAYQPTLRGILNMPLVGSDNHWTFLNIRWIDDVGPHGDNSFVCSLATEITSLNPLTTEWADEVEIQNGGARAETEVLSLVFDRLMHKNPYTLDDVYGMAEYREIVQYNGPSDFGPVDGMKFTYRLRSGLTWHCGAAFTTEDIKFALDKIAEWQPNLWINAWDDYVGTKIISSTEVEIYYNKTSLWLKDTVETVAAMLPKHIWDGVTDWQHFNLWQEDHPGNIQIPGAPTGHYLKKLCGTGPWIFDYTNPTEMSTVLYPNNNYWKSQSNVEDQLTDLFHWFGDVNYDGVVDQIDVDRVNAAWGSVPGSPNWDPDCDLNSDNEIGIEDARIVGYSLGKRRTYPAEVKDVAILDVTAFPTVVFPGQEINITTIAKNKGNTYFTTNFTYYYDNTFIGSQTVDNLIPCHNTSISYMWDTTAVPSGIYTILVNATIVGGGDVNLTDNTFFDGIVKIGTTKIAVEPRKSVVGSAGKDFSINVTITDAPYNATWAWEFKLSWNASLLNITDVKEGAFLSQDGTWATTFANLTNQAEGWVLTSCTLTDDPIGQGQILPTGNGTLATISFHVLDLGNCTLHLSDTILLNYNIDPYFHTTEDGEFEVLLGDIDRNGIVDIEDIEIIQLAYGSVPGSPNWNPEADIWGPNDEPDGIINVYDLAMCGRKFGQGA